MIITLSNIDRNPGWLQPGNVGNDGSRKPHGVFTHTPGVSSSPTIFSAKPASANDDGYFYLPLVPLLPSGFDLATITAAMLTVIYGFSSSAYLAACQAIEFEIQQNVGNSIYNGGVQGNLLGNQAWNTFDYNKDEWVPSGVPCTVGGHRIQSLYSMNHGDRTMQFSSFVIDDSIVPLNIIRPATAENSNPYFNVGFQLDGNEEQTPYEVQVHEISVSLLTTSD